ncbi:MAG: UDP-4-amino-4,6-dideoxy-N-acetyl-beta-L-altrosamine transaminase [Candidatus Margulisbacteria bacterium]|nr:UDP-4-amino-4,6-dideoxy-N-acetyl-beta-L-altrosamine transaminase [Candidatus Margulisiibacteriota bacterium]
MSIKNSTLKTFLPYGKQTIDQDDVDAVVNVLTSDYLTQGPMIGQFEDAFKETVGAKFAVAVSNGTAALQLSLLALGIGPGDEVITTPNSFLATSNSILYVGATPVFVDIELDQFGIDPEKIEAAITTNTKAIIPVHFAGFPVNLEKIQQIAKKHNLKVIEDSCHALGASYRKSLIGSCNYSDCSTFSFHPVKHIATGEGGMITTNSSDMYQKLLMLRTHGVTKDSNQLTQNPGPWYYEMQTLGFNYRMTDIQAALGCSQLKKLDGFVTRRREIAKQYDLAFSGSDLIKPIKEQVHHWCSYHLYVVQIDFERIGKTRSDVMHQLKEKGVGTQVHYIPIVDQPYYIDHVKVNGNFDHCRTYYKQALSLPMFPLMDDGDVEIVVNAIKEICK